MSSEVLEMYEALGVAQKRHVEKEVSLNGSLELAEHYRKK